MGTEPIQFNYTNLPLITMTKILMLPQFMVNHLDLIDNVDSALSLPIYRRQALIEQGVQPAFTVLRSQDIRLPVNAVLNYKSLLTDQYWPSDEEAHLSRKLQFTDSLLRRTIPVEDGNFVITSHWNSYETYTGRSSAYNVAVQAMPRKLRAQMVPPNGFDLVKVDISSAELRAAAYLTRDHELLSMLSRGDDVHSAVAHGAGLVELFGAELARQAAKKFTFSLLYGASDYGLQSSLNEVSTSISVDADAVALVKHNFQVMFPTLIQHFVDSVRPDSIQGPWGRIPTFIDLRPSQRRAYPNQMTIAFLSKLIMRLGNDLGGLPMFFLHDEVDFYVPVGATPQFIDQLVKQVTQVVTELYPSFPLRNLLK
ncbi:DNA polymerase [Lacticaseibacillus saniviri]|nr:DNA polymerase [Lacticaseibacillus saniviri]